MASPTLLPQITLQPSYPSVLADVAAALVPAEDVWVSCYLLGRQSVHGKVRVSRERDAPGGVRLDARGGVQVEWVNSAALLVSCPTLSIPPTLVRFPRQSIPISPGRQISSFSPSPDLSLLASGDVDGRITLTPLPLPGQPAQPGQSFTPHLSTILTLRILPSSKVLLSSGSDCQLQISPTTPPLLPARTLRGHKRGVTDTYVIHRGRQLLSSAKDGTVRLWDVPMGKSVRTFPMPDYSPAMKLAGIQQPHELDLSYLRDDPPPPAANDTDQEGEHLPLLAVALSSGSFTLLDLRAKQEQTVYTSPRPSPSSSSVSPNTSPGGLQSLALSPTQLYTGSSKGLLAVYDLRKLREPLGQVRRNESSLEDMVLVQGGLAVGSEDGLPWLFAGLGAGSGAGLGGSGPGGSGLGDGSPGSGGGGGPAAAVGEEWAGWECDAVRCVRAEGGSVWMAGDDGVVRRY